MEPIWPDLLGGIILLVCGALMKRFPMLIAGYNTMSAEKKKNVDIEGLSSFMQRHLLIMGALWIVLGVSLNLTEQQDALPIIYVLYVPAYAIWILVRSQRFDHNK